MITVRETLVVAAVCVFDAQGRLLTVRKRGTGMFMHPGGKLEPGESPAEAAARELQEEVGIQVAASELELLGAWVVEAANEPATDIEATVFVAPGVWDAAPAAEIEEICWLDLGVPARSDLAPLLVRHVIPALAAGL